MERIVIVISKTVNVLRDLPKFVAYNMSKVARTYILDIE